MNLNEFKAKVITEELLFFLTKNTESLVQQTQAKAQENLEIKLTK